uniref:Uncharacterized protein n=2 Tax=Panagrolaimus sp. JU765 TaxID=591449 RepID=A0AC34PVD8_9BILA
MALTTTVEPVEPEPEPESVSWHCGNSATGQAFTEKAFKHVCPKNHLTINVMCLSNKMCVLPRKECNRIFCETSKLLEGIRCKALFKLYCYYLSLTDH